MNTPAVGSIVFETRQFQRPEDQAAFDQLRRDLAARDAELARARETIVYLNSRVDALRERAERAEAALASVTRAYADVMKAVDECGSYRP